MRAHMTTHSVAYVNFSDTFAGANTTGNGKIWHFGMVDVCVCLFDFDFVDILVGVGCPTETLAAGKESTQSERVRQPLA